MLFVTPIKSERCAVLRHFFIHVFCLLALALSASLAYAGNKPLTLSEALSRAMAQNPTLQVSIFAFRALKAVVSRRIKIPPWKPA